MTTYQWNCAASTNSMDERIAEFAARQHGLITRAQLRSIGLSDGSIQWRIEHGRLHRVHTGVYAVGFPISSLAAQRHAATLAVDGSALCRRTAAHVHGLVPHAPSSIELVVPRRHRGLRRVRIRWTRQLLPTDVTSVDGIPVTTVTRTLLDLGIDMSPDELAQVMHQAARRRRLNIRKLRRGLQESRTTPGTITVERALMLYEAGLVGTRSQLERSFDRSLTRDGVHGRRLNARVQVDGETLEVDQVYDEARLCVEVDGPDHELPAVRREDARRDRLLRAAGWRVIRVSYWEIEHDLEGAIDRVRQAIRG